MIISASRRTDIPAFYAQWLIHRIRAGYCTVPNPYNRHQVARISLDPAEVDAIVFWTRNPRPLFPYLHELDQRGYRYYFQFTLMDNPRVIDQANPPAAQAIRTFRALAARVGPRRVIWRYDPIVLSDQTDRDFHLNTFSRLADRLDGATERVVISLMDSYRKIQKRIDALRTQGITIASDPPPLDDLFDRLREIALSHGFTLQSCAEETPLKGIPAGKCVDDHLLAEVFGIQLDTPKDPHQREACGCVVSRDIGMYDTCLFGCQYCYATSSFERARQNYQQHDPDSPSLIRYP